MRYSQELKAAVKVERKRIRGLEKELSRKEKAWAETAALLLLRKKPPTQIHGLGPYVALRLVSEWGTDLSR